MAKETPQSLLEQDVMPVAIVSGTPFKTKYNAKRFPDQGEVNTEPSMTIPDQSLTVAELVYRFTHGQPLGGQRTPLYDDDQEINYPANWEKLDISEKYQFMYERQKEYQDLAESLNLKKNQLLKEKQDQEIERRVQEKIKATRESRGTNNQKDDVTTDTTL